MNRRIRVAVTTAWFGMGLADRLVSQTITEFPLPAGGGPHGIAAGPDAALWFTEETGNRIGRITTEGVITEFPLPVPDSGPHAIVAGLDGNLWFTERGDTIVGSGRRIGRITTIGEITEFSLDNNFYGLGEPNDIAAGLDGNLWFTTGGKIGRMTPAGVVTEFPNSEASFGIAAGPDGNIWFTEYGFTSTTDELVAKIGRITLAGQLTEFPIPNATSQNGYPGPITAGPDGNLWFIEGTNVVGQITPTGVLTEFPLGSARNPSDIVTGPDGNLWFSSTQILRMTTAGLISAFPIPRHFPVPQRAVGIAAGHDGNLWFTESSGRIGRITTNCPDSNTLCLGGGRFQVKARWEVPSRNESGDGTAVSLTADSGYFWFFDANNVEVVVKALNACSPDGGHYWVFAGGLTNVGVTLTVTDMETLAVKMYTNPAGTAFAPIQDTSAFATCP